MADVDYEKFLLKKYDHWSTYLHENQAFLGRCYVALHRDGNVDPYTDTTAEEKAELDKIMTGISRALGNLYQPDMLNYANLRNIWPHCHWHVIPRYEQPRTIDGQEFTDENWGQNYAPYNKDFKIPAELLDKIIADFSAALDSD